MFADVEADIYVLVDGDATYDAASAPAMIDALQSRHLDMVVGARMHTSNEAYRAGHQWGNRALTRTVSLIFGESFTDMLSGYRVFSRRFVKSFPALSHGFETETELTIHAMELRMPCAEWPVPYGARPQGSNSKLNTWTDGRRILTTILKLFAIERPLLFYSLIAAVLTLVAIGLGIPLLQTYLQTGLVPRFPTAILCTGLAVLGALAFVTGLTQEAVSVGRREAKQFQYLSPGQPRFCSKQPNRRRVRYVKQILLFAVAGVIGFLVDAGVLVWVHALLGAYVGRLLSFFCAAVTTWLINRSLTFRHQRDGKPLHREFSLYLLTTLGGGAVNLTSYSLVVYLFDLSVRALPFAVAMGSLAGMLVNFWLSRRFVFTAGNKENVRDA